jgi:hypothetical protein
MGTDDARLTVKLDWPDQAPDTGRKKREAKRRPSRTPALPEPVERVPEHVVIHGTGAVGSAEVDALAKRVEDLSQGYGALTGVLMDRLSQQGTHLAQLLRDSTDAVLSETTATAPRIIDEVDARAAERFSALVEELRASAAAEREAWARAVDDLVSMVNDLQHEQLRLGAAVAELSSAGARRRRLAPAGSQELVDAAWAAARRRWEELRAQRALARPK